MECDLRVPGKRTCQHARQMLQWPAESDEEGALALAIAIAKVGGGGSKAPSVWLARSGREGNPGRRQGSFSLKQFNSFEPL